MQNATTLLTPCNNVASKLRLLFLRHHNNLVLSASETPQTGGTRFGVDHLSCASARCEDHLGKSQTRHLVRMDRMGCFISALLLQMACNRNVPLQVLTEIAVTRSLSSCVKLILTSCGYRLSTFIVPLPTITGSNMGCSDRLTQ